MQSSVEQELETVLVVDEAVVLEIVLLLAVLTTVLDVVDRVRDVIVVVVLKHDSSRK